MTLKSSKLQAFIRLRQGCDATRISRKIPRSKFQMTNEEWTGHPGLHQNGLPLLNSYRGQGTNCDPSVSCQSHCALM